VYTLLAAMLFVGSVCVVGVVCLLVYSTVVGKVSGESGGFSALSISFLEIGLGLFCGGHWLNCCKRLEFFQTCMISVVTYLKPETCI